MLDVLKRREYRLLWSGQAISHLGDQFHIIALPWLVLSLTHDPFQLGLVLALAGVPRAAVMLLGGAFADRHSPRLIMLASDVLRLVLTAAIAGAVLTGSVRLWMVYALAVSFGIVSGFFMPAAQATLPRLVERDQLEGGNALMMGADQFAQFVGPALAGTVIALFGTAHASHAADLTGVGMAFAVDAVSFAASAVTLLIMRAVPALASAAETHPLKAIGEGVSFAWSRPVFRWILALLAAANFLLIGPLMVGVPVLAQTRFSQGAAAFGLLISAYGLGNLGGMAVAGSTRRPSSHLFSLLVLALFAGFGVVIAALAYIGAVWVGVVLLALLGIGNGYIAVVLMTLLQRSTPPEMLGRMMSLVILAMLGVTPISTALAGAIIGLGTSALFVGSGAGMVAVTVIAAICRTSWSLERLEEVTAPAAEVV